ncbi:MAG: ABC transporter permease subunit [Candidatus Heimdallarchaeota archaeon]|nr:ABC transporter permease subunit [Candidatus Heimdallarchaeota archaeon]
MDKSVALSLKIIGAILLFSAAFVPLYNIAFGSSTTEPEPIIASSSYIIAGGANDIFYKDGMIYIADANAGMLIFNASNPTSPNLAGTYTTAGDSKGVYVEDGYAYVTDTITGLLIVNVTIASSPILAGYYNLTGEGNEVYVKDGYAYVTDSDTGLTILNVTDVTNPTFEGSYETTGIAQGIFIDEDYAFILDETSGLVILNVADKTNPILEGSYNTNGVANDFVIQGEYAFIVGESFGLTILNVTDVTDPAFMGNYDLAGDGEGIFVENGFAYITDAETGLQIIAVEDPTNPELEASYDIEGVPNSIYIVDGYAYIVDDSAGLLIFQVRPRKNTNTDGNLVQVLGFSINYRTLTYNTTGYSADAQLLSGEVPASVVILSAIIWFLLVFALLFTVLGQVFQSGGFKKRGLTADIVGVVLLLSALIAAIIAMNRSLYIAADTYVAIVDGQTALSVEPITFNPNDSSPSFFNIELNGVIGPGFYLFTIGIILLVIGIFLPVNWQKPISSEKVRKMGETGIIKWIKNIANLRLTTYITRRLLTLIPLFIAVCVLTFVMVSGLGDPVALLLLGKQRTTEQDRINLTRKLGLDQPIYVQFIMWFYNLLHGDMGTSFQSGQAINNMIGGLIWETLKLQLLAFVLSLLVSIPLGVLAAKNHNTWIDSMSSSLALLGQSMPIFVFGLVLIYIFSGYGLGWFPAAKAHRIPTPTPVFSGTNWDLFWGGEWATWWGNVTLRLGDSLIHMILPTITLLFNFMAIYTRLVRSTMLEVLRQDYILAARANGISERIITWKHAFRNTLVPVVTFVGLFLATALAGAPITETLFTWPGLGFKYVSAIGLLDFPMILGTVAVLTILILLGNLITDIVYVAVDPRIEL